MLNPCNNNNNSNGMHPLQQHQQSLPPEQQQPPQQINSYSAAYNEAQTYEGWPGMALKQIMGQIDLFNFQNPNYGVNQKWQFNKDFIANNSNGYMPQSGERMPINTIQHQQQPQQQQIFKTNNYENGQQQDNDNALAWLGPQLWNRRIGVDVSNAGNSNQVNTSSDQTSSGGMYETKIKTETSDADSIGWYSNNNNMDDKMSESSVDITEKDSFNQDEDFSAADLALVRIPGGHFHQHFTGNFFLFKSISQKKAAHRM
jgi:hypothetical protein